MRSRLEEWMIRTDDQGREPESSEMFESDMAVYVNALKSRNRDPAHIKTVEKNIELMRTWAAAGK